MVTTITARWARTGGVALALLISLGVALYAVSSAPAQHRHGRDEVGAAGCTAGTVALGGSAGVIRFSVRCHAPATGTKVFFSLARYPGRRGSRKPGILKFSKRPGVSGPGRRGRLGTCVLRANALGCHAGATGPITITGRILVRSGRQCARRIELKTPLPPECNQRGECLTVARVRVLAKGRPRGC